jgi:hypothetical protein
MLCEARQGDKIDYCGDVNHHHLAWSRCPIHHILAERRILTVLPEGIRLHKQYYILYTATEEKVAYWLGRS